MSNNNDPEPQPEECISTQHHRYNGRDFYGPGASERAEVTYLRDWKRWAERRLAQYRNCIREALDQ